MPLISVIVPIYNAEFFLESCIQSILSQTLKDIEIILLNDGSSDASLSICENYAELDSRIRVFNNKNMGQGLERNIGIQNAKGEYIAFIDSDDQFEPEMLEIMYAKAIENDADIVSAGYKDIKDENLIQKHELFDRVYTSSNEIRQAMADLIYRLDADTYTGCIAIWDSIFKKDLIDQNNIEFKSERVVYSEDLLFKLECMSKSKKIVYIKDMLYRYNINASSYTNHLNVDILSRIVKLHYAIYDLLKLDLKDYQLLDRITYRSFTTMRFNYKKALKAKDDVFLKALYTDQELFKILKNYKANTLKNRIVYAIYRMKRG